MKKNSNNQKSNKEKETNTSNAFRKQSHERTKNKQDKDIVKDEDSTITKKEKHKPIEKTPHRIISKKNVPETEKAEQESELSDSNLLLF